ncbi:MAG: hypothetical protein EXS51_03465 [Candidatus Taylorbacteria bacterium]|nr:hypothetical protein [Candidatus Taylorbacteria bacterium]
MSPSLQEQHTREKSALYTIEAIIPVEAEEGDVLLRAASVNYLADFDVAQAIVGEAKKRGCTPLSASKFESLPGKGAKALIDGMEVRVGSPRLLAEERIAIPVSVVERMRRSAQEGKIVMVVLSGRSFSGALILAQVIPQKHEVLPVVTHKPFVSRRLALYVIVAVFGAIALWFFVVRG